MDDEDWGIPDLGMGWSAAGVDYQALLTPTQKAQMRKELAKKEKARIEPGFYTGFRYKVPRKGG